MDSARKRSMIIEDIKTKFSNKTMLSRSEVAEYLGITTITLNNLSKKDTGPKFLRLGKAIRYSATSLADYITENES